MQVCHGKCAPLKRMAAIEVLEERVSHEAGRTLADYLRSVRSQAKPG